MKVETKIGAGNRLEMRIKAENCRFAVYAIFLKSQASFHIGASFV